MAIDVVTVVVLKPLHIILHKLLYRRFGGVVEEALQLNAHKELRNPWPDTWLVKLVQLVAT